MSSQYKIENLKFRAMLRSNFRARRNWARAGMVEWNGIFWLLRFSGILGQPREVHPTFRNEIPKNVCSIRSTTRNFRNTRNIQYNTVPSALVIKRPNDDCLYLQLIQTSGGLQKLLAFAAESNIAEVQQHAVRAVAQV